MLIYRAEDRPAEEGNEAGDEATHGPAGRAGARNADGRAMRSWHRSLSQKEPSWVER